MWPWTKIDWLPSGSRLTPDVRSPKRVGTEHVSAPNTNTCMYQTCFVEYFVERPHRAKRERDSIIAGAQLDARICKCQNQPPQSNPGTKREIGGLK
jgi:hypothetical protein